MTFLSFTITASQEPDQWEVDEEDDAGAEQVNEVGFFILSYTRVLIFLAANPGEPGEGCLSFCHFPGTGGEKKRSTLSSNKISAGFASFGRKDGCGDGASQWSPQWSPPG